MKTGLQAKILGATVLVVGLSFVAVWAFATGTARDGLQRLSDDNLKQNAQNLGRTLRGVFDDALADTVALGSLDLAPEALESGDPKNFIFFADQLVRRKPKYAALLVTSGKDGRIVASNTVDRRGQRLASSLRGGKVSMPWFKRTLESCRPVPDGKVAPPPAATWIAPSRPGFLVAALQPAEQVVGYSVPVRDLMSECIGTVTVFVSLKHVATEILSGYVSRSSGRVDSLAAIAQVGGKALLLPLGLERWRQVSLEGPKYAGSLAAVVRGPDGAEFFAVPAPIGSEALVARWSAVQLTRVANVEAPIDRIGQELLLVFVLALVLTLGILALVASRFLGPVRKLREMVSLTTKASDFKALPVHSEDEVGELTQSFNRMFSTIQSYEEDLEDKVQVRTVQLADAKREVSDILDNMSQGIFTINPKGEVNKEFSAFCKNIFGHDLQIAGAEALSLLQVAEARDGQGYGRMSLWLKHIFGSDELQWMLSESEPLRDLVYQFAGTEGESASKKRIKLEYAPIYKDDVVAKVMVVAKDATEVAKLEAEVEEKERQKQQSLSLMAELGSMDPELFETFVDESKKLLIDCDATVEVLATEPEHLEAINKLLRIMHTLKGNARIFRIASVQDRAHKVESYFEKVRSGDEQITPQVIAELRSQVRAVRVLVGEFEVLGRRVLLGESEPVSMGALAGPGHFMDRIESLLADAATQLVRLEEDRNVDASQDLAGTAERLEASRRALFVASARTSCAVLQQELSAKPEAMDVARIGAVLLELRLVAEQAKLLAQQLQACSQPEHFVDEAERLRGLLRSDAEEWENDLQSSESLHRLLRHAHTLKATARTARIDVVHDRVHQLEDVLADLRDRPSRLAFGDAEEVLEHLDGLDMQLADCAAIVRPSEVSPVWESLDLLDEFTKKIASEIRQTTAQEEPIDGRHTSRVAGLLNELSQRATTAHLSSLGLQAGKLQEHVSELKTGQVSVAYLVEELGSLRAMAKALVEATCQALACQTMDVFQRVSADTMHKLQASGDDWEQLPSDTEKLNLLLRQSHSLKAVARSHGLAAVQNIVHRFEDRLCVLRDSGRSAIAADVQGVRSELELLSTFVADVSAIAERSQRPKIGKRGARKGKLTRVPEARVIELRKAFKETVRALASRRELPSEILGRFESMGHAIQGLTMVPLADLFERFRKMVFDLSADLNKPVHDLQVTGDDIEVDVKLAERMRDVLIHALRNCVDHGIETPGERPKSKPSRGLIQVHCSWQEKDLVFEVIDDGRGINPEAVRAKAFAKGLLDEKAVDALADSDVAELLFLPGFSMAEKVSEVSGRGVGMDVIRSTMVELKGDAEITSTFGQGTRLTLRIPSDYYHQL